MFVAKSGALTTTLATQVIERSVMRKIGIIRQGIMYALTFVLVACYPYAAMADTQEPTSPAPETTTPAASEQEPAPEPEKPKLTYTYNEATGHWDSEKWQYNPATGVYETPPAPIIIEPTIEDEDTANIDKNTDTNVTITNDIKSDAASGDANVTKNTLGGNATSGDASAQATLLNVVNSTMTGGDNQKVAQFTQDILGDVKGDIILSPLLLKAMLEAQAPEHVDTTINANTNLVVDNMLELNATSGDAGVTGNTTGGNATSGSATAVANVVNILNSMIASQQSFIGTINIYGNLEGDILIAPDFIPQMIASNGGSDSDIAVSSQDTQNIVNNISAVAESGAASVFGNTEAGNATSGNAESNVVIFNLSGHEVVAENSLLVFVNVLGKWVGVIVDAPAGATAAMIGNGVTSNKYDPDITVNSQSNQGITNTIALNAQTGDALVTSNTTAGNAVSGDAKAMANVANVTGSQFSSSGWFGVLFINVFESWLGSFGVDTEYGNPTEESIETPPPAGPIDFRPTPTETTVQTKSRLRVIDSRSFSNIVAQVATAVESVTGSDSDNQASDTAVLSADTKKSEAVAPPQDYRLVIIGGSILVIGLSVIGLKRLLS